MQTDGWGGRTQTYLLRVRQAPKQLSRCCAPSRGCWRGYRRAWGGVRGRLWRLAEVEGRRLVPFSKMQRRGGAGGVAADSAGGVSTQDVLVVALGGNQVSNRAPGRPVGSAKSLRGGALMKGFRQAAPFASRARLTTRSTLSRFGPLGPPRFHRRTWALELLACMQSLSWVVHACRHSPVRPGRSFGLPIIQCLLSAESLVHQTSTWLQTPYPIKSRHGPTRDSTAMLPRCMY